MGDWAKSRFILFVGGENLFCFFVGLFLQHTFADGSRERERLTYKMGKRGTLLSNRKDTKRGR